MVDRSAETPQRMSMADMKELLGQLDAAELLDLPRGAQLVARSVLKSKTEEEFVIELRKFFHLLSEDEQMEMIKAAFDDPSELFAPIRRLIKELPEVTQQKILNEKSSQALPAQTALPPSKNEAPFSMSSKMKNEWRQLLSGGPDRRKRLYGYFETEKMRAHFKAPYGVSMYEEIIGIASEAGAPLDEVRARMIPLVGEERIDALANELIGKFINSGGLKTALDESLASMKLETERKREGLEAMQLEIEKRKRWWRR